jgi:hypothetical protein
MQVTTIGLDMAKNVFQVHGMDVAEKVIVRKQLRRRQVLEFQDGLPPCLSGLMLSAKPHTEQPKTQRSRYGYRSGYGQWNTSLCIGRSDCQKTCWAK